MEREKQELMMRLYQFEEKTKKAEKGEVGEGTRIGGTPGTVNGSYITDPWKYRVCVCVGEHWANSVSV